MNEGTLGNWVNRVGEGAEGTRGLSTDDVEELKRLRAEIAELRMERDVLKRSVVWLRTALRCLDPKSTSTVTPTRSATSC